MDVEKWLEKVKKLDELIDAKIVERDRLFALATSLSPKPFDDMPHNKSVVKNPMEETVIKLIEMGHQINKLIDKYVDHKKEVIKSLEKLPATEYGVLHRRYIQYMSFDDIANEMGYSRQTIWRYWKKGLNILKDVT